MAHGTEAPGAPAAAGAAATDRRKWLGLAVVALTQLLIVIDMTIVNVALPSINDTLGITAAERPWVITAYTLPFGGLLLLGGRITDYTGRRRALVIGLLGFAAASVLAGLAGSLPILLTARAAQGVFGALLAPSALSLLATTFTDPEERGKAFGVFGAVMSLGSPLGLVLGGLLTTVASWHWVFYVSVPIALIAAVGAMTSLNESKAEGRTSYDVPGAVLVTAGLVAIVYGFTRAAEDGWAATSTLVPLGAGVVLLAAFLLVEAKVANPLLPLRILGNRARGGAHIAVLLMMTGPFGTYLFVSFFLQGVQHYSALLAGLSFLPLTVGVFLSSTASSKIMTKVRPRLLMGFGLLLGACGMLLLTRLELDSAYAVDVLPPLLMIGLGMGLVTPPALNISTFGVPLRDVGVASAMFNVSQQVGATLDTALLSTVAAGATAGLLAVPGTSGLAAQVGGFHAAALCGAVVLAVAAVLVASLINIRLGGKPGAEQAKDG